MTLLKFTPRFILTLFLFAGSPPGLLSAGEAAAVEETRAGKAGVLLDDGRQFLDKDEYEKAAAVLLQAADLYRQIEDYSGEARALLHVGRAHLAQGQYSRSREEIEHALKLFQSAPDQLGTAHARLELGRLNRLQALYPQARQQLASALPLYQAIGDKTGEATVHLELGRIHRSQGRYQEAEAALNIALTQYQELQNRQGEADTRLELVWAFRFQGNYQRSQAEAQAALALTLDSQSRRGEAEARFALGILDALEGLYDKAQSAYEAAAASFRLIGMRHREAHAARLLARLHQLQGRYPEAQAAFGEALTLYLPLQDRSGEADIRWSLGVLHRYQGQYQEALKAFEEALALYKTIEDLQGIADVYQDLGILSQLQGQYRQARETFEAALDLYRKSSNQSGEAYARRNLSFIYSLQNNYSQAYSELEGALKVFQNLKSRNGEAYTRLELGNLLRRQNRHHDSEAQYQRALELYKESGVLYGQAEVQKDLGILFRLQGRFEDAKSTLMASRQLASQLQAQEIRWQALYELGRIHEHEGQSADALLSYQEAVRTLEGLAAQFGAQEGRAQYLQAENRLAAYDALADLLLKMHEQDSGKGYDREAWAVIEARKGRIAAEALAAARPKLQDPQARFEAEKAQEKQNQLMALERMLRTEQEKEPEKDPKEQRSERVQNLTTLLGKTKAEYLAQVQAFLKKYPRYKSQFVDQQTVDPRALAKFAERLPQGSLAVQYFPAPDALYLFTVAPGGHFQVRSLALSQPELYGMVKQYREEIEKAAIQPLPWKDDGSEAYHRDVAPLKELSRKLAAYLLAPIEAELRTHQELILIPNDLLLYLPIHALTREQPDGSLRFLVETHRISYLTQLELVDLVNPGKPALNAPLLALANPDGSLPAASREIRELSRVRPSVTTLDGSQATKAAFLNLAAKFPDLHLATHGFLDPKRPELSYLLMAGDEESNMRLGIDEIAGLSLQPNGLAILSACETALGEQVPGAALITLAAAFSQAGSQSILASLWKVNSATTRDLMVTFHRSLPAAGRAAALQEAQISILKNPMTIHPYYWAPFILIGAR